LSGVSLAGLTLAHFTLTFSTFHFIVLLVFHHVLRSFDGLVGLLHAAVKHTLLVLITTFVAVFHG